MIVSKPRSDNMIIIGNSYQSSTVCALHVFYFLSVAIYWRCVWKHDNLLVVRARARLPASPLMNSTHQRISPICVWVARYFSKCEFLFLGQLNHSGAAQNALNLQFFHFIFCFFPLTTTEHHLLCQLMTSLCVSFSGSFFYLILAVICLGGPGKSMISHSSCAGVNLSRLYFLFQISHRLGSTR